jgi:EAL domain-containing protein (putative c-di-GMP-specific phosphodiesterase class I)/GGDEF domain-containing protein/ABC-type amino acid transport substrate-binding protein
MKKIFLKIYFFIIFSLILTPFCVIKSTASSETIKPTITVGVPTDRCPMLYVDDSDNIVGIGIDLLRIAAENAGYDVTFEEIEEKTLKDALDNPAYDLVMPLGSAIKSAAGQDTVISEDLMVTPFTIVTSVGDPLPDLTHSKIGMLSSLAGGAETLKALYPEIEIVFFDTMPDCIDALRKDRINALIHNTYVWSYILQKPSYKDLIIHPSTVYTVEFQVGAIDTPSNRVLIDNLNQGIAMISDSQRQAIILDYTSRKLYKYTFYDYIYVYGYIIFSACIIIILITLHFISQQRLIKKEQENKIRQLTEYDSLTGAFSAAGFNKKVIELLQANPTTPYIITYNNIKNFKFINSQLGRQSGDDLLKFYVERVSEHLTPKEAIGRLDADHFVLLALIPEGSILDNRVQSILDPIKNFFINRGSDYDVQVSYGIYVLTPSDYETLDIDHMLDYARFAERKARESNSGDYEVYNIDQWEKGKLLSDVCGHFSTALKQNEIQVWYQPQVNYKTGKIVGAEALCRWNHGALGWISPGLFIPILEQANLIYELDKYVWDKVCQDIQRWNEQGDKKSISINLSRFDIEANNNIAKYFSDLTKRHNISPLQLRIEITEGAYVANSQLILETTERLHEYGFIVEMDDFGSGYSSLNMLKEVPVNVIKLDYGFFRGEQHKDKSRIIINHIIKMLRSLQIDLIAEGVETKEQADFLLDKGCDIMQGFYFFKPMPVNDFEALDFNNISLK